MQATATITTVIPGARVMDHPHAPTLDGHPDEHARHSCVAASIAEGLSILTGKRVVADELKDAAYGQGDTDAQVAWRYQQYCHDHGALLSRFTGSRAELVAIVRRQVTLGHPVVVTMPPQWAQASASPTHPAGASADAATGATRGATHAGLAVGVGPHAIRVMSPQHGFMQDASDEWWAAHLCDGEVWVMERKDASGASGASNSAARAKLAGQPTPFGGLSYTENASVWRSPATGHSLAGAFLTFYVGLRGPGGQTATQLLGLPVSEEYPAAPGKTRQDFERASLIYDERAADPWRMSYAAITHDMDALREQITQDAQTIADLERRIAALVAGASAPTDAAAPTPNAAAN